MANEINKKLPPTYINLSKIAWLLVPVLAFLKVVGFVRLSWFRVFSPVLMVYGLAALGWFIGALAMGWGFWIMNRRLQQGRAVKIVNPDGSVTIKML